MIPISGASRQPATLTAMMISLTACARVGFDALHSACPPVVEYTSAEQVRVAAELVKLPEGH